MINLLDTKISYSIIPTNEFINNKLNSILYSKDYTIFNMKTYYNGIYENALFCVSSGDSDDLRMDSLYIMEEFNMSEVIVKYINNSSQNLLTNNGSEKLLSMKIYDSNLDNKVYIYDGISFTFNEENKYYFPKSKSELSNNMIVEYYNNNKWNEKRIFNIDVEYENMYKLLIKYEKLRILCN